MTTLATHTVPVLISTDKYGLGKYEYEITGKLVTSNTPCITFRKCFKDAMQQAKNTVHDYLLRLELGAQLTLKDADAQGINQESKVSEWKGIYWSANSKSWSCSNYDEATKINHYLGYFKSYQAAVTRKKESNLELGLGEFHGLKKK